MNVSRAPKGIPTGGQFTATEHAEPTRLSPALARAEKALEAAGGKFTAPKRPEPPTRMRPALARAEKALEAAKGFAVSVDSNHERDMAEIRNNTIVWSDLLPKFLRRKNREAKAAEPEQESLEARNRRLAKVFGDAARAAEQMDSASSRMRDLSGGR